MSCCEPGDPQLLYRFRNVKRVGLGEPLPAGKVILYQHYAGGRQLVGEGTLADKTLDEEVELVFGEAQGVTIEAQYEGIKDGSRYEVTVRNANPFAVRFELEFTNDPRTLLRGVSGRLITKAGKRVWATTLAPNSEVKLHYDVVEHESDAS